MKGFSSSMQRNQSRMEMESPESPDLKVEAPLSGSYIHRLVKQLSSSRPREVTYLNSSDTPLIAGDPHPGESPFKTGGREPAPPPLTPIPTQQPKKQVRRRLNATRPYKERLLNMAEARREIVTALKFHRNRAAMKQAGQQPKQRPPPPQATVTSCNHHLPLLTPFPYASPSWAYRRFTTPLPLSDHNLGNFTLPSQPLGLNLNFQGFIDVETPLFRSKSCSMPVALHQSTSSSSSSSTSPSSSYHLPSSLTLRACNKPADSIPSDPKLHPVMGDEEMEQIRSMSEKHDMEWNDALNSATTARWSKLLKAMEEDDNGDYSEGDAYQLFSEAMMDIQPAWVMGQGWIIGEETTS